MNIKLLLYGIIFSLSISSCFVHGGDDDYEDENPPKKQLDPNKNKFQSYYDGEPFYLPNEQKDFFMKFTFGSGNLDEMGKDAGAEYLLEPGQNILHALHLYLGNSVVLGSSRSLTYSQRDAKAAEFVEALKIALGNQRFKKLLEKKDDSGETGYDYLYRTFSPVSTGSVNSYSNEITLANSKLLPLLDPDAN